MISKEFIVDTSFFYPTHGIEREFLFIKMLWVYFKYSFRKNDFEWCFISTIAISEIWRSVGKAAGVANYGH